MDRRHLGCGGSHLLFAKGWVKRPFPASPRKRASRGRAPHSCEARKAHRASTGSLQLRADAASATRGVRAQSGWGKASSASHRGRRAPGTQPACVSDKAPDLMNLDSAVSELPRSRGDGRREIRGPTLETRRGSGRKAGGPGPEGGYRRSVGRARGSIRWQKSTDGAWPCAPGREERSEAAGLAAPPPQQEGEPAKERRKPAEGGKALRSVAGPRSRSGAQAQGRAGIRRWKAPGRAPSLAP